MRGMQKAPLIALIAAGSAALGVGTAVAGLGTPGSVNPLVTPSSGGAGTLITVYQGNAPGTRWDNNASCVTVTFAGRKITTPLVVGLETQGASSRSGRMFVAFAAPDGYETGSYPIVIDEVRNQAAGCHRNAHLEIGGAAGFAYTGSGNAGTKSARGGSGASVTATGAASGQWSGSLVQLLAPIRRHRALDGSAAVQFRLRYLMDGRATFIVLDPTGGRLVERSGTRVGRRLITRNFTAPVKVTATTGKTVLFHPHFSARPPKNSTLRIVFRDSLGNLRGQQLGF